MKLNFRGIKFNMWLLLALFALGIIGILGLLQFTLIRPYYRDDKISSIKTLVNQMQEYLIDDDMVNEYNVQRAFQVAVNNNVCAVIYNDAGQQIYSADSIGASCVFNHSSVINNETLYPATYGSYLKQLLIDNEGEYSESITNTLTSQSMIVYGKVIKSNLGNYYLFVNGALEPVDSLLSFLQDQYLFYTIIVVLVAFLISIFISSLFSKPIVKMKKAADHLAEADYEHTHFDKAYFSEMNDLSTTLNEATDKLAKVDDLRKDLIANVSHDIKTPLTMIKAYAEMIKDISGDNKEKREEHLDVIIKEVDYLDHLVLDMQELSKMQSGTYELIENNFDITQKTKDIIELCEVLISEKHLNVVLNAEDSITIFADEVKIGQVIYNFLSNAIKHSDDNKSIYITIIRNEDSVKVEVKDEGEGIKPEDLPYIWDRYYKIDKQYQRASLGSTGLGLSIVKAILDTHKAKYGVESKPNEGSVFWFELPQENG